MLITKPYAKLEDIPDREAGINLLRKIERIGRVSHRSEDSQDADTWLRFISAVVLSHGDWSIVEHASATVEFLVDRGITHELVRHRLCAFTQESTRFVNYAKKLPPTFIEPPHLTDEQRCAWLMAIGHAEKAYLLLIDAGCAPQIARSVFPNGLASKIVVTTNLRNWRHVLLMRTTRETHPQMREVMLPLLAEFQFKIPLLFGDIEPLAKQSEQIRKGR